MTPRKVLELMERMDVQYEVSYDDSPYLFAEKFSEKQKTLGKVS